jgi:hypothetical protein
VKLHDLSRFHKISRISRNFRNFQKFQEFPEFPGISGISGISRNSPDSGGENLGVFSRFQAVIVGKHAKNGRSSEDDIRDFPEFPEISGNFPKMSGISPGFRGENSGAFSRFQAVIVYKSPKKG